MPKKKTKKTAKKTTKRAAKKKTPVKKRSNKPAPREKQNAEVQERERGAAIDHMIEDVVVMRAVRGRTARIGAVRTEYGDRLELYGTDRKALKDIVGLMEDGAELHVHRVSRPDASEMRRLISETKQNLMLPNGYMEDEDDED